MRGRSEKYELLTEKGSILQILCNYLIFSQINIFQYFGSYELLLIQCFWIRCYYIFLCFIEESRSGSFKVSYYC